MKTSRVLATATVVAVALLMLQGPLQARADDDPPGRVARLNYSDGSVSFQPAGEGDWVQAVRNRPLTTGDNLWADKDSRAELQIGSTSVRVDSETSITLLQLDDRITQVRLSQGSVIVRVRHLDDEDNFEIDTPNSSFRILRTGEYRVDVNADGNETAATVWRGRGEVTGGGASFVVVANQRARFTGTDELNHEIEQVPAPDDFDNWAFERDRREDRSESANYISPEITGYQDLDENGSWHYVASYGTVWTPFAVAPGWAPYRFGHWVWVEPWGWTWVEDEPWGFAPFHYGRWAFVDEGWCWVPGPVVVRPVYAPALVAFVGGGGFAFGFGTGVAWFPLAPQEVFVPWYRTSPGYVNNVNITNTRVSVTNITNVYNTYNTNTTNITNIHYANQHVVNGVTAVSHDTFVNARPVATNLTKVDFKQIEGAPVARNLPVQPVRQSVMGTGRPTAAKPPVLVMNRPVVATRQPTLPRAPFEQRQPSMNVRTEAPGKAEPLRSTNEPPRPSNPVPRPGETSRPTPTQTNENRPPIESGSNRPEMNVPRPPASRLEETSRPTEPSRATEPSHPAEPSRAEPVRPEGSAPRPLAGEGGHPLVRQAPPVQERPELQRSEEQKFNTWRQQREAAPRPPQPHAAPSPHSEPRK